MFDLAVPFFIPAWRRQLVVIFCFGWCLLEFATGNMTWGILFAGFGAIAVWQFHKADWEAVAREEAEKGEQ